MKRELHGDMKGNAVRDEAEVLMVEAAEIKGERGVCGCGMLPVASTDN